MRRDMGGRVMIDIVATASLGPLKALSQALQDQVQRVIVATAFRIEADAKIACPVDTGALRASIFTTVQPLEAVISVGMEYGPHVEFGTTRQVAQPFLYPAAEKNKKYFEDEMKEAVLRAGKDTGWTI